MTESNDPLFEAKTLIRQHGLRSIPSHLKVLDEGHLLVHGKCHCDTNPSTTNGPEEDCPRHGRDYTDWVDYALAMQSERNQSSSVLDRLRHLHRSINGRCAQCRVEAPCATAQILHDPNAVVQVVEPVVGAQVTVGQVQTHQVVDYRSDQYWPGIFPRVESALPRHHERKPSDA